MDVTGHIAVVGAGSWGTALAHLLGQKGYHVDLWVFEREVYDCFLSHRENKAFLPNVIISENIHPCNDLEQVVAQHHFVVLAVPSHVLRTIAGMMKPFLMQDAIIVTATKGIENDSLLTMTQVLSDVLPSDYHNRLAVISGPTFAREVARNTPTALTVASYDQNIAQQAQTTFAADFFRVYTSHDVRGVELGGALKNVIAIAAGVSDGLNLGHNTRAALITRGLTEMRRLGVKMGADPRTFYGLTGMGDLVLTCTSDLSRNRTVGMKLAQGFKLNDILKDMCMVAEGVKTTKSVYDLSKKLGVDMPIAEQTYDMLYMDVEPLLALKKLMTRSLKDELE
ncbi:MAG: NAD(P)H-dependent glycerol-3-phosphate dehydrogenase [Pseudomonadota bacterium]